MCERSPPICDSIKLLLWTRLSFALIARHPIAAAIPIASIAKAVAELA
jgi:hypothetical protein